MALLDTEVLVVGSGAGGAVTAATLARAAARSTIVEEGPWVDPDSTEPFSLEEMVAKYRHGGSCAALGRPAIAYAEGRCVGGSTEINSGLYHRLPGELADEWQRVYRIDEFGADALDHYSDAHRRRVGGVAPSRRAADVVCGLERGAAKLGWQAVEFSRVFRYEPSGRAVKQTMARTLLPRAMEAGATRDRRLPCVEVAAQAATASSARAMRTHASRRNVRATRRSTPTTCSCARARPRRPRLLQRSGIRRNIGNGLKMHPTVKIAARFDHPIDHGDVPMHRVTEFAPGFTIGGSASRRGHVALALADSGADYDDGARRLGTRGGVLRGHPQRGPRTRAGGSRACGRPLVTYNLTDGDMSRLARALLHLGEVLLAAGATEMYPSVTGGVVARGPEDLVQWWDATSRNRANLMTVHLTSTVRIGENRDRTGADSFGRVWGFTNLHVNDASLLPDAPGVNPQGTIMAIAARNSDHFLSQ